MLPFLSTAMSFTNSSSSVDVFPELPPLAPHCQLCACAEREKTKKQKAKIARLCFMLRSISYKTIIMPNYQRNTPADYTCFFCNLFGTQMLVDVSLFVQTRTT